jgi:hypothetical protein
MRLTAETGVNMMSSAGRLALLLAALVPLAALAEEPAAGSADQSSRTTVDKNGRTHVTTISTAKDISVEIQAGVKAQSCDATIAIEYEQRNTVARVEATIENPSCAACSGDYTIAVRVRDESGELRTLEFPGKWERADDKPVKLTADYPVGTNVDVVNVRTRGLHCVCAAAQRPADAGGATKE